MRTTAVGGLGLSWGREERRVLVSGKSVWVGTGFLSDDTLIPCRECAVDGRGDDERGDVETFVNPQRWMGDVFATFAVEKLRRRSTPGAVTIVDIAIASQRQQPVCGFFGCRLAVETPRPVGVLRLSQP